MRVRLQRLGWLLAALSAVMITVPISTAAAAPTLRDAATVTARLAPLGEFASTLTFTISDISPALITATSATSVRIAGTVTNTGDEELTGVVARIQRGAALTDPAALQADIADPGQPVVSWTAFAPVLDSVSPGQTVPFSVAGAVFGDVNDSLAITTAGVYPIMLNVNAQFDSGPSNGARVGEFHALLTVASVPATSAATGLAAGQEPPPADPVPVAQPINLVVPLVDRPHRDPTGAFFDDDLAALLSHGGRLERVLTAAESASLPPLSRTLAVDPELLEEVQLMSQGYTVGPYVFDLATAAAPNSASSTAAATTSTTTSTSSAPETPSVEPTSGGTTTTSTTTPGASNTASAGTAPTTTASAGTAPTTTTSAGSAPTTTASATSAQTTTTTTPTADTTVTTTPTTSATPGVPAPVPGPSAVAGTGTAAADDFLQRLRKLATTTPVLVLPYADLDTVAAVRNGHADQVTAAITRGQELAGSILGSGARLVTDISWPIDGLVDDETLSVLRSAGLTTAVLDVAGVSGGSTAKVGAINTPSGTVTAVLASSVVPEGPTELNTFTAVTAQNYFSAVSDAMVLAPDRSWQPDDAAYPEMTALIDELGTAGIVTGTGIASLRTAVGATSSTLSYPDDARARELPASTFGRVEGLKGLLADTQAAFSPIDDVVPGDRSTTAPDDLFAGVVSGLARQFAGGFRIDPGAGQRSDSAVQQVLDDVQSGVFINRPTANFTLTSSSSPLLVTVTNNLPYTVHLRVHALTSDLLRAGITVSDVGILTVQAQRSLQVVIPAETTKAGTSTIRVQLTTPDGVRWGPEQTLQLRSTAYGAFTVTLIVIAGIVVVLSAAIRIVKRYRQRQERIEAGLQ